MCGLTWSLAPDPGTAAVSALEQVTACVRVPDEQGERVSHVAEFKTTVRGLLVLRDWLKAHRVTQVTMEATGVYWKPVGYVLEDEFELVMVNARHVK